MFPIKISLFQPFCTVFFFISGHLWVMQARSLHYLKPPCLMVPFGLPIQRYLTVEYKNIEINGNELLCECSDHVLSSAQALCAKRSYPSFVCGVVGANVGGSTFITSASKDGRIGLLCATQSLSLCFSPRSSCCCHQKCKRSVAQLLCWFPNIFDWQFPWPTGP